MVTENNSLTNTFIKGMNTDTSHQMIDDQSYSLAKNLRLVSLSSTNVQGELIPIEGVKSFKFKNKEEIKDVDTILAALSIRQYGIIIVKHVDESWCVYRFENNTDEDYSPELIKIFETENQATNANQFEVLGRYEDSDNVKLYIADGDHFIMSLNVAPSQDEYNKKLKLNEIYAYPEISWNAPRFVGYTTGNIKPGTVQYSYRLYKKNGMSTDISPATTLIPIINRQEQRGYKLDDDSTCGINIEIDLPLRAVLNGFEKPWYDRLLIYRILYTINGQQPLIQLIYNGKTNIPDSDYQKDYYTFKYSDNGQNALQQISIDEYNSFSGIHIIPETIESKNDYLFAGNIKTDNSLDKLLEEVNYDTRAFRFDGDIKKPKAILHDYHNQSSTHTIELDEPGQPILISKLPPKDHDCYLLINDMDYLYKSIGSEEMFQSDGKTIGGSGVNISWKFVLKEQLIDVSDDEVVTANNTTQNRGKFYNFDEMCMLKSLKRGELYRYGIIFYDKFGQTSSVKWIADIKTPQYNFSWDLKQYDPFISKYDDVAHTTKLYANFLGVEFTVKNLPSFVKSYEIVRCNRTEEDIRSLTQGVLSRPIRRFSSLNKDANGEYSDEKQYPLTPMGYLTVENYGTGIDPKIIINKQGWTGDTYEAFNHSQIDGGRLFLSDKHFSNTQTYLFVSGESTYNKNNTFLNLDKKSLKLEPLRYVYPINLNAESKRINKYTGFYTIFGTDNANYITPSFNSNIYKEDNICYTLAEDRLEDWPGVAIKRRFYSSPNVLVLNYSTKYNKHGEWYFNMGYVSPNFGNETIMTKPEKWYDIKPNVYSYIKLYNASYAENKKLQIKDVLIALESNWDDYAKAKDGKEYDKLYKNNNVVIGDDLYCNFVTGGTYDMDFNDFDKNDDVPGTTSYNQDSAIPVKSYGQILPYRGDRHDKDINKKHGGRGAALLIGTGGRSLLISLTEPSTTLNVPSANPPYFYSLFQSFGTYLCNITHTVTTPYGGYDNASRNLNVYYSSGNYSKNKETITVYDGDCFLFPIEYVSMHKIYTGINATGMMTTTIIYSIPLESSVNLLLTYGFEFSRNSSHDGITNIQIQPASVEGHLTQSKAMYEYNTAYSANNKTKMYAAYNDDYEYDKHLDCRVYHSQLKSNDEYMDSWLQFKPNDQLDVDTKYGEIVKLKSFGNNLYFWLKDALGVLSVNERAVVSANNNMPLILGEGGVLTRYDYIDENTGMLKNFTSVINSSQALYYYDKLRRSLKAIQGTQLIDLSNVKNVLNLLKNNDTNKVEFVYDDKYGEVIANVLNGQSLVYNEKMLAFQSIYTPTFDKCIKFNDKIVYTKEELGVVKTGIWNKMTDGVSKDYDNYIKIFLQYTVNKSPLNTKVFDNQELVMSKYYGNDTRYTWSTDTPNNDAYSENLQYTDREKNFRYAIPRHDNAEYGNRLRGKYMVCTIEKKLDKDCSDASLSYILTKFRGSLS